MGLQMLAPRAKRRIEKALNVPGKWFCFHKAEGWKPGDPGLHPFPGRVSVVHAVSNGGYAYFFTVKDPARENGHRHGWMDLKMWRQHVQWPWGDLPGLIQSDCEFKAGMPEWWRRHGVWNWDDDPCTWYSCKNMREELYA